MSFIYANGGPFVVKISAHSTIIVILLVCFFYAKQVVFREVYITLVRFILEKDPPSVAVGRYGKNVLPTHVMRLKNKTFWLKV